MLSERRARILSIIVSEYLGSATPVGSEAIQRKHALGVSPATIRNDMASLEQEGYITHTHTSAGRIPVEKGYRYYIDALMPRTALPADEQLTIQHQFYQASQDLEQWVRLAATVLARSAGNAALVAPPRSGQPRLKRVELIPLRDLLLLVLVVLQEARIKRQIVALEEP
ncbi:MAG: DeoR family transcriptional regulator [Chloroflexi bacterium]|nr:DeoR family transcriptional regulator [Chloroflexota bacterium]